MDGGLTHRPEGIFKVVNFKIVSVIFFTNTSQIEAIIERLDKALVDYHNLCWGIDTEYRQNKTNSSFDLVGFIQKNQQLFTSIDNETYKYLSEATERGLYLIMLHNPQPLAIERHGYNVAVNALVVRLTERILSLKEIILHLTEQRALLIRKEISDKEYLAGILYQITFNDHSREVCVNNIRIAKPTLNSANDYVIGILMKNPNRFIGRSEFQSDILGTKTFNTIVRELGFSKTLRKIFFPSVQKSGIYFVNPITYEYAQTNKLPILDLNELVRRSEVE